MRPVVSVFCATLQFALTGPAETQTLSPCPVDFTAPKACILVQSDPPAP